MASRRRDRQLAFVLSILGHGGIVAALTFSIPLSMNQPSVGENIVPIEAVMIDAAAIEAEISRIEAEEEAERLRQVEEANRLREQQEAEQRELERIQQEREAAELAAEQERVRIENEAAAERERLLILEREREEAERIAEAERLERERQEAERLAAEQAAEEERQRLEEERRREEEERRRQEEERLAAERAAEEERLRLEAEERARREAVEAEIARAIAAEQAARAAQDAGLRDQWSRAISDRVARYWTRPPNVSSELECVLVVTQLPNGEVIDVAIERCNTTDGNIIRSVENAVLNASPLPQPPRGVAFERVVRITFIPID